MNKNNLYIKEWIELVSCEKQKPSMKYNGTVNSSTKIHCSVLYMDLVIVQDFLIIGIGFLHIHRLDILASLEGKIKPATCIPNSLARFGYFSFSILHTHFLLTAELLLFLLRIFVKFLPLNWWLNLQIYGFIPFH